MNTYAVGIAWSKTDRWITVEAKNSTEAKRLWCKRFDDPWCGASMLEARKVKEHA